MNRATLARLRKLEVKARPDGSIENLTDVQLFSAFRDLVERGGGDDAFFGPLEAEGEGRLAQSVLALTVYRTPETFMAALDP